MNGPHANPAVLRHNDYGPLVRTDDDPVLSVSVVVPAHGHQDKLDVTLAALAAQTSPADLLEVVVVDDGSTPPLRLPELRPEHTRLIAPDPVTTGVGWASAHATNTGAAHSDGDVILRLDSDMLVFDDHVASQLRWHHTADYLAVLGHKRFVDYRPGDLDPAAVFAAVREGRAGELFDAGASEPQWIETIIDVTGGLREADHRAFRVLVGASFSVHRSLFEASGGMDAEVVLGSDTVFGYRLHQAGAVFVPDDRSSSWHLGPRQIAARGDLAKRYRRPHIANRVPELDRKRPRASRGWDTPLADVIVVPSTPDTDAAEREPATDAPTASGADVDIESCVDALLSGSVPDLRVTVLGKWPEPVTGRHAPLDDPDLDARLLVESFRGEPRVRFAAEAPVDPRVPYRLHVPDAVTAGPEAVASIVAHANEHRLGLVEVALPQGMVRLERTAAAARAAHLGVAIDAVWGYQRVVSGPLAAAFTAPEPSVAAEPGGAAEGLGGKAFGLLKRTLGR
ncbi:glycosyltransferase [Glycomyces paridis]|uniref:Glycosyltransferase family 2 protein n=1 Tax=Glycomyces paridis TaxID=2126555 RepID=A0A4V4HQ04_9ACTN|nr:glycosyltransferase family A protein [Glycomyces paridis]THV31946.1 glycosyltransferase family 2 protein [Glycomyces paridis]